MSTVKLTIDGREVEVVPGTTIYEAANKLGVSIPAFCYDPGLAVHAACRICVVEVEKARALVASCAAPAVPGMVVRTSSERVVRARRSNLKLILANHPLDCLTCEKTGECKLQDYCYLYEVDNTDYFGERHDFSLDLSNPFFERDLNKCILCGKCVRRCHEINGVGAIDYIKRGFDTKVATAFDESLEDSPCVFCGMCVDICPVGALTARMSARKGRPWELKTVKTVCPHCATGCGIELHVKDEQVVKVSADFGSQVSRGEICARGHFGCDFVNGEQRITSPLIKNKGIFVEASWDEALDLIARRFNEIKTESGADAIAGIASASVTNEEAYVFQKFMRTLGTNNIDCYSYPEGESLVMAALVAAFGSGGRGAMNSTEEIDGADLLLVFGADLVESHPVISYRIKMAKNKGTKLIVVDPRSVGLADVADLHLHIKPGVNTALLNGFLNLIIEEELVDDDFISKHTEGFGLLKETVAKYTAEYVSEITGITVADLQASARLYAGAKNALILYNMSSVSGQGKQGAGGITFAASNLAMATGNIGRASAGVNFLRGQCNSQGVSDMGLLPDVYPGYREVTDHSVREVFSRAWGAKLSDKPGLTVAEMFADARKGKVRAMYVMGVNSAFDEPSNDHLVESLKNLDFLVVQDIFLTETAQYADLVLPSASFAEKEGTFTNTECRVQRVRQAINPSCGIRSYLNAITDLAERFGFNWEHSCPQEIMEEVTALVPGYAGISYELLEEQCSQWSCFSGVRSGAKSSHENLLACSKGVFTPVEYKKADKLPKIPDKRFPLLLITGSNLFHGYASAMSRYSAAFSNYCPPALLQINTEDAAALGIKNSEIVNLSSRHAAIQTEVEIVETLPPGVVFLPFHKAKVFGGEICAVRIRKIV